MPMCMYRPVVVGISVRSCSISHRIAGPACRKLVLELVLELGKGKGLRNQVGYEASRL